MTENTTNNYVGKSISEWDIDMQITDSTRTNRFRYSSAEGTLEVYFIDKKGEVKGVYNYYKVPKALVTKMMNSPSVGKFIESDIIPNYESEKVIRYDTSK